MLLFLLVKMRWWHENRVGSVNIAVYEEKKNNNEIKHHRLASIDHIKVLSSIIMSV
jgi:hypothetical protein